MESPDGIQPADGWSMGSKGERSLPSVMGCRGAGTFPDWWCNGHALRWHIPPLPQSATQISFGWVWWMWQPPEGCNGRAQRLPCQDAGNTPDILRITLSRNLAIAESIKQTPTSPQVSPKTW